MHDIDLLYRHELLKSVPCNEEVIDEFEANFESEDESQIQNEVFELVRPNTYRAKF